MLRVAVVVLSLGALLYVLRQASGRLAPRAALAPLLFLVTRLPVLGAWLLGTCGWAALLIPKALARGNDSFGTLATLSAIAVVCGGGVAVMVVGPVFVIARLFTEAPQWLPEPGEHVEAEVSASHFLNGEARGGKLFVTSRRLVFRPHRFNVQLDVWSMPLEDLTGVTLEGQRLIVVQSSAAKDDWLVVAGGGADLAARLEALVSRADGAPARPAE